MRVCVVGVNVLCCAVLYGDGEWVRAGLAQPSRQRLVNSDWGCTRSYARTHARTHTQTHTHTPTHTHENSLSQPHLPQHRSLPTSSAPLSISQRSNPAKPRARGTRVLRARLGVQALGIKLLVLSVSLSLFFPRLFFAPSSQPSPPLSSFQTSPSPDLPFLSLSLSLYFFFYSDPLFPLFLPHLPRQSPLPHSTAFSSRHTNHPTPFPRPGGPRRGA